MAVKKVKKAVEAAPVTSAAPAAPAAEIKKAAFTKPKKAAVKASVDPKSYVVVDHPQDGEIISGLHYAIRIGASDNGSVEISFDGGEWQPCRASAGYWWFDWGYFTPGIHDITVRLRDAEGQAVKKSSAVRCEVK